jgi:hypothetical protein
VPNSICYLILKDCSNITINGNIVQLIATNSTFKVEKVTIINMDDVKNFVLEFGRCYELNIERCSNIKILNKVENKITIEESEKIENVSTKMIYVNNCKRIDLINFKCKNMNLRYCDIISTTKKVYFESLDLNRCTNFKYKNIYGNSIRIYSENLNFDISNFNRFEIVSVQTLCSAVATRKVKFKKLNVAATKIKFNFNVQADELTLTSIWFDNNYMYPIYGKSIKIKNKFMNKIRQISN